MDELEKEIKEGLSWDYLASVPAKQKGWMSRHGHILHAPDADGVYRCPESGLRYSRVSSRRAERAATSAMALRGQYGPSQMRAARRTAGMSRSQLTRSAMLASAGLRAAGAEAVCRFARLRRSPFRARSRPMAGTGAPAAMEIPAMTGAAAEAAVQVEQSGFIAIPASYQPGR